jgi:hypothetical protein
MLTVAALVLVAIALVHSFGGEVYLLRHLPELRPLPSVFGTDARRTLRACWHTATVLGLGLAGLLWRAPVQETVALTLLGCSLLWLVCSRGRHLGWLGFLAVAALAWYG